MEFPLVYTQNNYISKYKQVLFVVYGSDVKIITLLNAAMSVKDTLVVETLQSEI